MASIDATIGGEDSNSYCDQTFADDYFDTHFNTLKQTTWTALSDDQKTNALIQACDTLEQFRYTYPYDSRTVGSPVWDKLAKRFTNYQVSSDRVSGPTRYYEYQRLQFPRNVDYQSDGTVFIPEEMKRAQCEQAVFLCTLDETALTNRLQGLNLDRIVVGKGQIELTQEYAYQGTALAPLAAQWIQKFLLSAGRIARA